jgi:hypothetical protein
MGQMERMFPMGEIAIAHRAIKKDHVAKAKLMMEQNALNVAEVHHKVFVQHVELNGNIIVRENACQLGRAEERLVEERLRLKMLS